MRVLALGDKSQAAMFFGEDAEYINETPFEAVFLGSHLQTVQRHQVVTVLEKLAVELPDGGRIIATVPSLEWACKEIVIRDPEELGLAPYISIYGTEEELCKCGFTMAWLRLCFEEVGMLVVSATSEWFTMHIGMGEASKEERAMQHVIIALKREKDPKDALTWLKPST